MLASLLITLREGLEAALIVGIMLSALRQLQQPQHSRRVWGGVAAAIGVSLIVGIVLYALGIAFEGRGEYIFEGLAMLTAAGVLTWMIFWMQRQAPAIKKDLERDVRSALNEGSRWALFSLAFVAVVREGIETALFLTAAVFSTSPLQTFVGGAIGLAAAVGLGWLIFVAGKRLNLGLFFRATSLLLLIVAAGLVAHGVHELQEAAWLPVIIEQVWDINPLLDENGLTGQFLKALFGYNANPSLLEVVVYGLYFGIMGWFTFRSLPPADRRRQVGQESSAG